ncbi:ATP-binding protein [Piscinibacter sp. XHJ-5]|uniref:hybrid sensor histidine kinase/response regulator n=1 Tax=Piscinibacter sp. XHJ-5 TaxID=3037797 RepID=UPI002452C216|nr:ATP-binding protein [Piscinibacter sp. XHJ-5]
MDAPQTQLALAMGLVGIALWRRDLETHRMQFNAHANEVLGRRAADGEMTEQQMWTAIHPDDRQAVAQADQKALAGSEMVDVEVRCLAADGSYRPLMTRRVAERDMQGRAVALIGVALDLTEQRRTQERLALAEQRTVLAAKAVGLANWERDMATGEVWWDAQMYRLRGLWPDDPRPPQRLHLECTHPDDVEMVHRRIAQVIEHDNDFFFEFRILRPDGAVRWLATRGSVTRDGAGRALRLFGFNWDITEHKRGEDVRREKAAAEEASRAKSQFLSRMSHELRTPLNAVLGFAQLLLEDATQPLAGRQRERTQHIQDAGRHLLALIDDVLDLTSVEVGAVPLAARPVALAPLVDETLQWLAPAAQRANVTLSAGAVEATVQGDARRLRQVLANLLSNAVKYNRPGGRVEVSVLGSGDASRVGLRVRDSGRGLTPVQLQGLFEPFNRLGAEREGIEGTGIGLTIVRALVEAMGGRIEVESTPGSGTEFRVWLPAARDAATRETPVAAAVSAGPVPLRPIDLLYIEDNTINVLLVQELVALRPHVRLHVAAYGRSGIERARELRPQGVLIDLQLPDIDGFEVLRALRSDPSLNGVVCIALSANAMPEDVARARSSGFDDYWTKPIDFSQFLGGLDALARGEPLPVR